MIMLDTSALIRWVCIPEKLSKKARETIDEVTKKEEVYVSSISIWEIALLIKKGRIGFFINSAAWLAELESLSFIRFIPIDNQIAQESVNLDENFHKDPADRMIVATAILNGAKLITSDQRILKYKKVQTIW